MDLKHLRSYWLGAALALTAPLLAQGPKLQGRVFVHWGYNRAQFNASDIHFTGKDYDFILHDVVAQDRPEAFSFGNYFAPKNIWIPQYNYRVGWFANEHWSFSLGMDHMKYVMVADQRVKMTGTISPERSVRHAATEPHEVDLTEDLLRYEHTDGLNLLSLDVDGHHRLWSSADDQHGVYLTGGLFAGPVIPRTDVRLFGEGLNNRFHLAGYGLGAQGGLFGVFWGRATARLAVRAGYIDLPSVLTTGGSDDRARQHFWFAEQYLVLGVLLGK